MKNFYLTLIFISVLNNYTALGQFQYVNIQTCNTPQIDYAGSVPANNQAYWDANNIVVQNPDNADTTNPYVLSVKGNNNANHYVSFILPNPISPTAGETFSLRFYAPNAGSLNTGTGRVIVKFWNSSLGLSNNIRQFVTNKTGGVWQSITGNIDDAQSATQSFDRVAILAHNSSQETETFDPLYLDDFVISNDQSYDVISLDNGNSWIDYPNSSQANYTSRIVSDMTLTADADNTPQACPNSGSSKVTKLTRGSGISSRVSYTFNGPIKKENAIFKMRMYPISGTARVYALLRTSTDNGADQLISPVVNYSSGVWHDIIFDFSVLTGGATGDIYNALNIRIDWNLASTTENNDYLIDALQGPTSATLSAIDFNSSLDVFLQHNPVTEYLSLNQEVERAEIINVLGKSILNFEHYASHYDVSSLSNGIYFVKVSKANRSQVMKFIKK